MALLPTVSPPAVRTFTINDGAGVVELNIVPTIIDKFGLLNFAGLTKTGPGRLSLAGDNTFGGTVTISGGASAFSTPMPWATMARFHFHVLDCCSVIVNAGSALEFDLVGTNTIDNEFFSVNGSGIVNEPITASFTTQLGTGAVRNIAGNNTISLAASNPVVTMPGDTLFNVAAGRLIIDGILSQVATTATEPSDRVRDLEFAGSASNEYLGNTIVNEGKLVLNKTGAAVAVGAGIDGNGNPVAPGGEILIGDVIGGDNSAIVEIGPLSGGDQINDSRPIHVTHLHWPTDLNNQNGKHWRQHLSRCWADDERRRGDGHWHFFDEQQYVLCH